MIMSMTLLLPAWDVSHVTRPPSRVTLLYCHRAGAGAGKGVVRAGRARDLSLYQMCGSLCGAAELGGGTWTGDSGGGGELSVCRLQSPAFSREN